MTCLKAPPAYPFFSEEHLTMVGLGRLMLWDFSIGGMGPKVANPNHQPPQLAESTVKHRGPRVAVLVLPPTPGIVTYVGGGLYKTQTDGVKPCGSFGHETRRSQT